MINHLCREKLDNMNANKKVKIAAAAIAVALCCEDDDEERRKDWVKPWLQRRNTHGFYSQLLSELCLEEVEIYKNYLRMIPENFNEILVLLEMILPRKIHQCVNLFLQKSNLLSQFGS